MASVWVARLRGKHGFEKLVAIKTILADRSDDLRFREMFLDEARIASGIDHVNTARILDLGEHDGVLYLVMEWVDGESASRLMRAVHHAGGDVPPGIALRVVADACRGLHAAHELRARDGKRLEVVHRDVSPQNILVGADGIAKVIDFGIAKARDRIAGDTSDGALKGKLHYMAPEQALGKDIDRRADVWALGAVLYHVLAGSPPYKGPNDAATFAFLTSGLPPQPLPARIPAAVSEVVMRALSPLERRYPTAADLEDAIEAAMSSAGLVTRPADVAECLERNLGDRLVARRALVREAVKAVERGEPLSTSAVALSAQRIPTPARPSFASRFTPAALAMVAACAGAFVVGRVRGPHDGSTPQPQAAPSAIAPEGPGLGSADLSAVNNSAPVVPLVAAEGPDAAARPDRKATPASKRPARGSGAECDPPYTTDSAGIRRYKRTCLH
jgi:serine/threonine-protein kinase